MSSVRFRKSPNKMKLTNSDLNALAYQCNIARARLSFWDYCNVKSPKFYKPERKYLFDICSDLNDFFYNNDDVLIINVPPRHGKSRTACNFVEWAFGQDPSLKIITGSYNEMLSINFSTAIRNTIMENKSDQFEIVYSDIFPNVKISKGDGAKNIWSLNGSPVKNYLATSPTGTATGFGADFVIIDDLIKNADEALNSKTLDKQWDWFINTILSRLQGKRKVIIIMTQWATRDLAHRAYEHFSSIGVNVKQICHSAFENGKMLDDEILPEKKYRELEKTLAPVIFLPNYQNKAVDMVDDVFGDFKTYKHLELEELENKKKYVVSQTDTADEGSDFLCKITALRVDNLLYVIDVYYTQDRMEITEQECWKIDMRFRVNYDRTESNNGGKGFARSVENLYKQHGGTLTKFEWHATTANKEAKILTNATGVCNTVIMPEDWAVRFPEFYRAVVFYSKNGKNEHDDAPDCLTQLYISEFEKKNYIVAGGLPTLNKRKGKWYV